MDPFTASARRVLHELRLHGPLTPRDLRERCRLGRRTVYSALRNLGQAGMM